MYRCVRVFRLHAYTPAFCHPCLSLAFYDLTLGALFLGVQVYLHERFEDKCPELDWRWSCGGVDIAAQTSEASEADFKEPRPRGALLSCSNGSFFL